MLAAATARHEVATRLGACALTAGRVFEGRYHPADEAEVPCWFVAIEAEDVQTEGLTHPGISTHSLRFVADGFAVSVDALEATLDTLQLQALQALHATQPPFLLRVTGTRRRAADAEGQASRAGVLTLYLEATFHTQEGQPETLIP